MVPAIIFRAGRAVAERADADPSIEAKNSSQKVKE
jgi:hypothetical protein